MRNVYLSLAVVGAVVPYFFFFQYFAENAFTLTGFLGAAFANGASGGLTADLLVTSLVFWIAIFRRRSQGGPNPWPFVVINLLIGLSCALPAYLWAMGRDLKQASV